MKIKKKKKKKKNIVIVDYKIIYSKYKTYNKYF